MALISEVSVIFFVMAFLADRLPLMKYIRKVIELNRISFDIIGSGNTGDADKQKLLLANSAAIFVQSLKLSGSVLLVLAAGCLLILAGNFFNIVTTSVLLAYLETITGIVISVLAFCFYFLIKKIYDRARL